MSVVMHADHFIWSAYGHWMPSCPRESWPRYIRSWERGRGVPKLSIVSAEPEDTSLPPDPYRLNRMVSDKVLKFPPIHFSPNQIQAIAQGFERCTRVRGAYMWACCILPDYVQILITSPRTPGSQMMGLLRTEATKRLQELDLHPLSKFVSETGQTPLMWSHTKWHLQLKDDEAIREVISYIQDLPAREGEPPQNWSFVRRFDSLAQCREEAEEYVA